MTRARPMAASAAGLHLDQLLDVLVANGVCSCAENESVHAFDRRHVCAHSTHSTGEQICLQTSFATLRAPVGAIIAIAYLWHAIRPTRAHLAPEIRWRVVPEHTVCCAEISAGSPGGAVRQACAQVCCSLDFAQDCWAIR